MGRRIGELAAATGLTVRTLHYYEEIGLLTASGRSEGGHRLYAPADVERTRLRSHLLLPTSYSASPKRRSRQIRYSRVGHRRIYDLK